MAKVTFDLVPAAVPALISLKQSPGKKQDGFNPAPQVRIETLSKETVEAYADQFKIDLLEKWKQLGGAD